MLKDITLGQFFPGNSAVHRLDPRVKIVLTVAFIVLLFLAQGPVSYALIIAFLAVVIGISRISPKMVLRGLKPILFIVIFMDMGTETHDFIPHLALEADNDGHGNNHHRKSESNTHHGNKDSRTGNLLARLRVAINAQRYKAR